MIYSNTKRGYLNECIGAAEWDVLLTALDPENKKVQEGDSAGENTDTIEMCVGMLKVSPDDDPEPMYCQIQREVIGKTTGVLLSSEMLKKIQQDSSQEPDPSSPETISENRRCCADCLGFMARVKEQQWWTKRSVAGGDLEDLSIEVNAFSSLLGLVTESKWKDDISSANTIAEPMEIIKQSQFWAVIETTPAGTM